MEHMSGNEKVKWQQFIVHHATIGGFLNNVVRMKHVEVTNVRVNRTYSIDFQTIAELNNTISAKHRSKFVDKAIKHRLNGCESSQSDIETKRLMAILHARDDCSPEIKALLLMELTK